MNWASWLLWGFVATIVLTTILAASQGFHLTRMNIPYLLGTYFTADRDRAKAVGLGLHAFNGWIFSILYVCAFHAWGGPTWWRGAGIGLVHAGFVLACAMPLLPAFHPRMASEHQGPTATRQIEPPGFFALHYGVRTPISVVLAHIIYGIILGLFYRPH